MVLTWAHRDSGQSRCLANSSSPDLLAGTQLFLDKLFWLWDANCSFPSLRYIVMSGTPEKILEHFLETMRLEATLNEATGTYMVEVVLLLPHKMDWLGEHCNVMLWKSPRTVYCSATTPRELRKARIKNSKPVLLYLYFKVIVEKQNPPRCQTSICNFN